MKNTTNNTTKSEHPIDTFHRQLTTGQRAADRLTSFMGSWTFIIEFGTVLLTWVLINIYAWWVRWDPYPFILLNLFLSCLAAIQAPIIMMSENRQAQRDRISASYDHAVNRKAEREIENMQKDLEEIKEMIKKIKK